MFKARTNPASTFGRRRLISRFQCSIHFPFVFPARWAGLLHLAPSAQLILILLLLLLTPPLAAAQQPFTAAFAGDSTLAQKPPEKRPETWKIDNLKEIGGSSLTITGQPRVIKDATSKAIAFDGKGDGLLVNRNPIAGARVFTIEAIFRPEAGGDFEQRWLHIQDDKIDDRALLELRATGNEWFLDTFIKSGENRLALLAEKFKHPIGPWYHVALVFDGVTMRHYVDGKEEMSGPLTISFLGPGKTSLGVRMNHISWFKGAIREVRFTQRALTPAEFLKK